MALDVLAGLSEAQADVVRDPSVPVAVVAGPGAGKTRVLTRRIAWRCRSGDAAPGHTLALTFSRRAAGELRTRLHALGLGNGPRDGGAVAGTFHAVAWAQLSRWRADAGRRPLGLLARPGRLAQAALADALGRTASPAEARALLEEIAWARRAGASPSTYADVASAAGRWPPWALDVVGGAWAAYAGAKHHRLVVDLDDLLETAAEIVERDPQVAATVRWRHRHVYVDEYQDLNPVHLRLLRAWVGDRTDVCLVGDPDQAVYGFNGACPDLFGRLERDWPGVTVRRLTEDFRSSPELVRFTSAIPGVGPARASRRAPGPLPRLTPAADEGTEAAGIAASVLERHASGAGWGRMAVLARTNARLRVIASALSHAGVPWHLRDPRPLSERPAVEAWLAEAADSTPIDHVRVSPDDADLEALAAALEEYRAEVPRGTVAGFRAWLEASGPVDDQPNGAAVDLVTFHRAKGLEWDAVWVAGVEEDTVPLGSAAATPDGLDEERRLLYVALTRAGEELTVSWAGTPSRWVGALAAAAAALGARPPREEQVRRLALLRRRLEAPPDVGASLVCGRSA